MNSTLKAFGYPESLIKEYKHWVVLLRPVQVTVGSLVIAAESGVTRLGQLGSEEWSEFAAVSKDIESLLIDAYGAEKFNYLALMMKDPNVHFHFIPRYSKPVSLEGKEYTDPDWPLKTELTSIDIAPGDLEAIKLKLRGSVK